ncbi:NYN domain-containing protein [Suillus paluster]|uniref:NYN domain-containing protein n=1 Tax=Suillus paluster TaxID=48578 RepID=UPI001B87C1E4|nr:NYN domain-containing protein [Suillus paluster]KAG1756273.1 NYN domain-containing protein [Suillus paluster]
MSNHRKVAVFWDYENCSPPLNSQGHAIVNGIRRIAHVFGNVTSFKAYLDISSVSLQSPKSVGFRSDLQSSGVSMIDCPHNGKKDVVDKMILVDMLTFAVDNPSPATIILIAGDRDYAYAVSTLRLRQYTIVLIVPPAPNIPQCLESQASVVVDWNFAILGKRTETDTSPVRQPYRNLDEDIVERLSREIRELNEDPAVTLLSSAPPATSAHTQRVSAEELLQPSVSERNTGTASGGAAQPASTCTPKKVAGTIPQMPARPRFEVADSSTSPPPTEVDDDSHAYVVVSAESFSDNGWRAGIANSPSANGTFPTTQPSVTPTSPISSSASSPSTPSSLTLSDSDSNVTSSDVEIGSQQATSVISDNKDNSSGCQPPLIESVEDKVRRLTPLQFLPMINLLLQARSNGIMTPSRSVIAVDLLRLDKEVYQRAGVTKFAQYTALAEQASLIELGRSEGSPWMALHPNLLRQDVESGAPESSSTPSTVHRNNSPTPQDNTPYTKTPTPSSPMPSSSTASPRPPTLNPDAQPFMTAVPIPLCFQPLVTCLMKVHSDGIMHPLPSTVGLVLGPAVYSQAGTSNLREYLAQAVDHGVVECGWAGGNAWVRLHMDVLSGKRYC